MEPQIRYVRSADGTNIATATLGAGPPVVLLPTGPLASIEGFRAQPDVWRQFERFAEQHTFIAYDRRGSGLSDREVDDLSLEAEVADLHAVVESLGEGRVALLAQTTSCPTAIVFAATQPPRVGRLVLWDGLARGRDLRLSDRHRIISQLIDVDFELYCLVFGLVQFGWTDDAKTIGLHGAKSEDPATMRRRWQAFRAFDATASLGQIQCSTLIVAPDWLDRDVPIAVSRDITATIPGARMHTGGGLSPGMFLTNPAADGDVILAFLAEGRTDTDVASASGTAIILFTDIADSTGLTERLGDATFRDRSRALDVSLREIIARAGGTTIDAKTLGDGVLATFPAASQGIDAAVRCAASGDALGLPLHVGLHAGDVIREDGNVFGGAVNIASRISAQSAPGEVLVSDIVRGLARTSASVAFEDRGEHALKGIADAMRVYAVRPAP